MADDQNSSRDPGFFDGLLDSEGPGTPAALRNSILAIIGLTLFVMAMFTSYAGAFGKPLLHELPVAVAAPPAVQSQLSANPAFDVHVVTTLTEARSAMKDRTVEAALVVPNQGAVDIVVGSGGGRSIASAVTAAGEKIAGGLGRSTNLVEVAPLPRNNPSRTVEFYAVIFISLGATLGSTVIGRILGTVGRPKKFVGRTVTLAVYSAVLAGCVTTYADAVLGALPGHGLALFGALWLYAMAVGAVVTGLAALWGTVASLAFTLLLVVLGNSAAGGAVGRHLLPPFFRL